ncbi:MAG TPA: exodeoxyribonuclease VII small subunit [Candidatus Limiplasma sp.]|nr:exodeoxyribonuclease VII small subunit [Candidatus Limiplasma sp.]
MSEKKPSFEEDLAKLESLAEQMEQGEMPLEKLMDAYEKGAKLAKSLEDRLKAAAARLHEVSQKKDGSITTEESDVARQESLLDNLEE